MKMSDPRIFRYFILALLLGLLLTMIFSVKEGFSNNAANTTSKRSKNAAAKSKNAAAKM